MLLNIAEMLFSDIGKKIKRLALVTAVFGVLFFIIGGVILLACLTELPGNADFVDFVGIFICMVVIVGCFLSFIGSYFIYGFGELIDQTIQIRAQLSKKEQAIAEKKRVLTELYNNNLITQEEYESKMMILEGIV